VVGFSTRGPVFNSSTVHVGYAVEKVVLGQVFPLHLQLMDLKYVLVNLTMHRVVLSSCEHKI
jgi:hypothetical protein